MNYKVNKIDQPGIIRFWPTIDYFLTKALRHTGGEMNKAQLLQEISKNTMELWILTDKSYKIIGIIITGITMFPNKKVFCIYGMSAETVQVASEQVMKSLFDFAKKNDCQEVSILARRGWGKILPKFGFKKEEKIILTKEL